MIGQKVGAAVAQKPSADCCNGQASLAVNGLPCLLTMHKLQLAQGMLLLLHKAQRLL